MQSIDSKSNRLSNSKFLSVCSYTPLSNSPHAVPNVGSKNYQHTYFSKILFDHRNLIWNISCMSKMQSYFWYPKTRLFFISSNMGFQSGSSAASKTAAQVWKSLSARVFKWEVLKSNLWRACWESWTGWVGKNFSKMN